MNTKERLELAWFSFSDYEYSKYHMWPKPKKSYMILWKRAIAIDDDLLEWDFSGVVKKLFYSVDELKKEKERLEERIKNNNEEMTRIREHATRILYPTPQDEPLYDDYK